MKPDPPKGTETFIFYPPETLSSSRLSDILLICCCVVIVLHSSREGGFVVGTSAGREITAGLRYGTADLPPGQMWRYQRTEQANLVTQTAQN